LPQRGYLWQREWTPAVLDALDRTEGRLDGVVLLGAEIDWNGEKAKVVKPSINWQAVSRQEKRCSIALRVAPFSGGVRADDPRVRSVLEAARSLLDEARKHGVEIPEFQVDFDCAQKDLASYREWLRLVREKIRPTRLVITTLPAWLDEPAFLSLAREVDGYVLQVHSVPTKNGESMTLCDPRSAERWIEKAARLRLPFSVALPTYRCSAGYGLNGKLLSVAMDSVQPVWPPGTRVLEFASNPDEIATLVDAWQKSRPRELRELLWYRVPATTDTRNWQWVTLSAVMSGRKPLHYLEVRRDGENPIDLSIANTGEADEELDSIVTASWEHAAVVAADALPGWVLNLAEGRAIFTTVDSQQMKISPGAKRQIGWLRYERPVSLRLETTKKNEAGR
jgi:Protein of unknown function (DUF3142)